MQPTPKHRTVERRFLRLLEENQLQGPDEIEYEPGSVWCLWHDQRLTIAVDFDDQAGNGGDNLAFPLGDETCRR